MSRRIRVLFFTGDLGAGGSEAHLLRLLLNLDRTKIEPMVMLIRAEEGHRLEAVRAAGIPVFDLRWQRGMLGRLRGLLTIGSVIRGQCPDILQSYGYTCDVYGPVVARLVGTTKIVTTRRGNQPRRGRRMIYRLTNPLVDRVVCVSRSSQAFAHRTEKLSPHKTMVIPNGVDLSLFRPKVPGAGPIRRIGTLGRVRQVKGFDLLLEAFTLLKRPDLVLELAGRAETDWGFSIIAQYEGVPGVRFRGDLSDAEVPSFLGSLDLFVLPSRSEGMSNALLEAMATGLPIVATDVGSNREVLADGQAGLLVAPDAGSIAAGIASLVANPDAAGRLGTAARRRVEEDHDLKTMVRRYERLYEELAGLGAGR